VAVGVAGVGAIAADVAARAAKTLVFQSGVASFDKFRMLRSHRTIYAQV
jgi:hypothetical protein